MTPSLIDVLTILNVFTHISTRKITSDMTEAALGGSKPDKSQRAVRHALDHGLVMCDRYLCCVVADV